MKKRLLIFACFLFAVFLRHQWIYREIPCPFSQQEEEIVGIEIIHFKEVFPFNKITTIVDIPLSDQKEFLSEFKSDVSKRYGPFPTGLGRKYYPHYLQRSEY